MDGSDYHADCGKNAVDKLFSRTVSGEEHDALLRQHSIEKRHHASLELLYKGYDLIL